MGAIHSYLQSDKLCNRAKIFQNHLPNSKTFMPVDPETIGFDSDVVQEILFNGKQVSLGLLGLGELGVELLDGVVDSADLLDHLDVGRVIAVLNLRPVSPLLQSTLRHFERRSLGPDGGLDLFNVGVLVLDLLLDHAQLALQLLVSLLTFLCPLLEGLQNLEK